MLEELKNLNYHGGKDGLLFFLCDVIGRTGVSIRDAEVICSHAPGKRQLSVEDLVSYCLRFLYKGIIIKHNKTEPTYTKTSLFLCEKRRFFMARTEKGVVTTI